MVKSGDAGALLATSIPSVDFGGSGQPLHFLHANGYPPGCYAPLIGRLVNEYQVFGMLLRPLWPAADPASIRDWKPFSEDLRQLLHQAGAGSVIGLGHSIGAVVTLRTALSEAIKEAGLVALGRAIHLPNRKRAAASA